ncbi:MAG: PIN domain-containing protein [Parapedobacter sp.]|nr:MAG: PIN domain-containing protein [Parapedobacter sp.]
MVIDTSLFIEHLRAKDKSKTKLYGIANNRELFVSAVSIYELYMGATTDEKRRDVEYLTDELPLATLNRKHFNRIPELIIVDV